MALIATAIPAFSPYLQPVTAAPAAAACTVATAGDIATAASDSEATAKLVEEAAPTAVLTLGDHAYDSGTAAEFKNYYDPTWGRFKNITKPSPGNHEYNTDGGSGYYDYFGVEPYYAFDVCGWHALSLNSEEKVSEQAAFVKAEATKAAGKPMIAYWHKPRFSSSANHGSDEGVQPLWDAVTAAGVKIVLNGHDHTYERFAAMNAEGASSKDGTQEFVIGTGGAPSYEFGNKVAGSEKQITNMTGIGVFTLRPNGYDYEYRQTDGTSGDKGTVAFAAAATGTTPAATAPAGTTGTEGMPAPATGTSAAPEMTETPAADGETGEVVEIVPDASGTMPTTSAPSVPTQSTPPTGSTGTGTTGSTGKGRVTAGVGLIPESGGAAPAAGTTATAPSTQTPASSAPTGSTTTGTGKKTGTVEPATDAIPYSGSTSAGSTSTAAPSSTGTTAGTGTTTADPTMIPTATEVSTMGTADETVVPKPVSAAPTAAMPTATQVATSDTGGNGDDPVEPSGTTTTPAADMPVATAVPQLAKTGIDAAVMVFLANLLMSMGLGALYFRDGRRLQVSFRLR